MEGAVVGLSRARIPVRGAAIYPYLLENVEIEGPEIFNIDRGSQFTSEDWRALLKAAGVAISMDGKERRIDNVFVERLWCRVKYEDVYLRAYACGSEARRCLSRYFAFYNAGRVHESLGYATPDEVNFGALVAGKQAAARRYDRDENAPDPELLPPFGRETTLRGNTIDGDSRAKDHCYKPLRRDHLSGTEL